MSYIIKNTSGLINTRLTDVGRRNISQGNFSISYFQIGDSEVNYTGATNYNIVNNNECSLPYAICLILGLEIYERSNIINLSINV